MFSGLKTKYVNTPVQVRASLWFLICSFLQRGISMLTTPIFMRLLSTSEYGQYSIFNSWLGIITIFVSLSLAGGVYTQGLVKFEEDKSTFSSTMQGLNAVLVVVWMVIYLFAYKFWNSIFNLTTVQMIAMLIMIWTTSVFGFWSSEQRTEYKYKALVIVTVAVSVLKPIIGVIFVVLADDKVTARILGLVLVELLFYSVFFIVQMKNGKKFYSGQYWKYALIFNIPLVPHYLSQIVLNSADRIMIGKMVGDSQAGIYSLAYSLSSIMLLFNTALMQTLNPWIYQKIKAKKIRDIESIAYISLIIIALVNLFLILLAPEAVALFAPKTYGEAIYVIPPVAISVYFMFSYDLFAKFAFYYEKTKLIMIASVLGAILNIVLNYVFIPIFGYIAAGYTTLICYVIYSVAHYILMNIICKTYCKGVKPYATKKLIGITLPFVIVSLLLLLTYDYPIIRYSVISVGGIMCFFRRDRIVLLVKKLISLRRNDKTTIE